MPINYGISNFICKFTTHLGADFRSVTYKGKSCLQQTLEFFCNPAANFEAFRYAKNVFYNFGHIIESQTGQFSAIGDTPLLRGCPQLKSHWKEKNCPYIYRILFYQEELYFNYTKPLDPATWVILVGNIFTS